jgi:hypothetical protein
MIKSSKKFQKKMTTFCTVIINDSLFETYFFSGHKNSTKIIIVKNVNKCTKTEKFKIFLKLCVFLERAVEEKVVGVIADLFQTS